MIPGGHEFIGIRLVCLDLDMGMLRVELLLDDGSVAASWWPLDDIPPHSIAVASAELDRNAGFLRIGFLLCDGVIEPQHWEFTRLRSFMGLRVHATDASRPTLQ